MSITLPENVVYVAVRDSVVVRVFSTAELASEWIGARYKPATLRKVTPEGAISATVPAAVARFLQIGFAVTAKTKEGGDLAIMRKTVWTE